jgi:hypothetical protein
MRTKRGLAFILCTTFACISPLSAQQKGQWVPGQTALPARLAPFYSVHAIGFQTNFILPEKNLNFFVKHEPEYLAKAHPQGRTVVFGDSWKLRKPQPQPKP